MSNIVTWLLDTKTKTKYLISLWTLNWSSPFLESFESRIDFISWHPAVSHLMSSWHHTRIQKGLQDPAGGHDYSVMKGNPIFRIKTKSMTSLENSIGSIIRSLTRVEIRNVAWNNYRVQFSRQLQSRESRRTHHYLHYEFCCHGLYGSQNVFQTTPVCLSFGQIVVKVGADSEEHRERLHQETKSFESRFQGQYHENMMGDACLIWFVIACNEDYTYNCTRILHFNTACVLYDSVSLYISIFD